MPEGTLNENNNSPPENIEENKDELNKRIERLRELVKSEETLHVRNDDNFMLRYLRCSQHDPDYAFKKMKIYYGLKKNYPQWYAIEAPFTPYEKDLSKHSHFMLQGRDKSGKQIYVNRLGRIDTSKSSLNKEVLLNDLFIETMLEEEETQKNGLLIIVDSKDYSWKMLKWLTPKNVYISTKKFEALPFKKLELHVVNTTPFLTASFKLFLPILNAKTRQNIIFHNDWPSLHKYIDPENLPVEYGGNQDINVDQLLEMLHINTEKLTENLSLGYR